MSLSLYDEIYMEAAEDMADNLGGWINELMDEIKTEHWEID